MRPASHGQRKSVPRRRARLRRSRRVGDEWRDEQPDRSGYAFRGRRKPEISRTSWQAIRRQHEIALSALIADPSTRDRAYAPAWNAYPWMTPSGFAKALHFSANSLHERWIWYRASENGFQLPWWRQRLCRLGRIRRSCGSDGIDRYRRISWRRRTAYGSQLASDAKHVFAQCCKKASFLWLPVLSARARKAR